MSLPGVESARRRRASHGRSSAGFVQPPPLRRRSTPHPVTTSASFNPPLRFLDPADQYCGILNERALAARHRLDERLRDPAACRRHDASSISRPSANEKLHRQNGLSEEKLGGQQDDCPVCLDCFLPGQTVVCAQEILGTLPFGKEAPCPLYCFPKVFNVMSFGRTRLHIPS